LLLTMVAMVHRYHGALPGSRIELYAEICQVLLGRWRQAKGVKDKLSAEQKLVVLRPLAAQMMTNRIREITVSSAKEIIGSPLERVGMNRDEAERFLSETQSGSGLLLEREAGRWSFAHLTFQEFLTLARPKRDGLRLGDDGER
jgi:predicted NACHT family NTPase